MHYELIINPKAGNKVQEHVIKTAHIHIHNLTVSKTTKQGDAARFAKNSKADVVIAAGGDGTLNEVISGLLKRKKRPLLGIFPIGTGNMFAKYLHIPGNIDDAIQVMKEGYTRTIDVGTVNDMCFVNAAGVGFDAETFKNVQPTIKKLLGTAAYAMAGFQTLLKYTPKELTIKTKDLSLKGYFVIVCNMGKYTPAFNLMPHAKIDDGKLDVLVFNNPNVLANLRYLMGVMTKHHTFFKDVTYFQTTSLKITSRSKVLFHADAEDGGSIPVDIGIQPGAIEVLCPHITKPKEFLDKSVSKVEAILEKLKDESAKKLKRLKVVRKT